MELLTAVFSFLHRDCYPILSRQFYSLPSLSLSSLPLHEATYLASLIWLLEPAVCLPPSSLPPTLTSSLLTPLLSTLPHWVEEVKGGGEGGVLERLVCVRAVLHVLASHLSAQTTALVCHHSNILHHLRHGTVCVCSLILIHWVPLRQLHLCHLLLVCYWHSLSPLSSQLYCRASSE